MTSIQICSFCNSNSLETEDNLRICTQCGFVVEETSFQNELPDFDNLGKRSSDNPCNLEHVTNWMRRASSSCASTSDYRLSSSKRLGLQLLAHCTDHFRFDRSMKVEASNFYRQLVNDTVFTSCSRETKMLLAGVCAYLILNRHDFVITKHAVAKQIGCSIHEFGQVYTRVLQLSWISKPKFFSIDQHVSSVLQQVRFDSQEFHSIEQTTMELIRLQQKCRQIESVFPPNLIFATSFYAWKCEDIEHRFKISLDDFRRQFHLQMNLRKPASAVNKFLLQIVELIPWLRNDTVGYSKRMVVYHIKDVLEHPNSLVNDYLSKYSLIDSSMTTTTVGCATKRKNDTNEAEEEEEDGDREILDSEIDCYIRNEEEVRLVKRIRERLEKEGESDQEEKKKKRKRKVVQK